MSEQINYDKLINLYISGDHRAFEELVLIHRSGAEKSSDLIYRLLSN